MPEAVPFECLQQWLPAGVCGVQTQAPADLREFGRRQQLTRQLGLRGIQFLQQCHGRDVHRLAALADTEREPVADAAFTTLAGMGCAVLTADCLPVLLATESGDVVAAAHAGWRGLAGGVLEAIVAAMPCEPGALRGWLGPAIGERHFEVGPEVRATFLASALPSVAAKVDGCFTINAGGRYQADLYELARIRLRQLGVSDLAGGDRDSFADPRYFSWRGQGERAGRQATLIWRLPGAR